MQGTFPHTNPMEIAILLTIGMLLLSGISTGCVRQR